MIYIITDNHFIFEGVRHVMHPLNVIKTSAERIIKYKLLCSGDIVLIDDNVMLDNYLKDYSFNEKKVEIVFLNTLKNANIDFMKVHSLYHSLNRHISIKDFRTKMLEVITGKNLPPARTNKKILTMREHQVLLASVHGKTIREIATATGLNDKTVYYYRKSACLKLGVVRFIDVVPFSSSLMVAASLPDTETLNNNIQSRLGVKAFINGYADQDKGKDRVFQPFMEANWVHNTRDFGTTMDGATVKQKGAANVAELKMGVEGQLSKQVNLWGNVGQQVGSNGYSDSSAMVGIKYNF